MAQVISHRPLTLEVRDGQTSTGPGFSPSTSVFPCTIPLVLHHIQSSLRLYIVTQLSNPYNMAVHPTDMTIL